MNYLVPLNGILLGIITASTNALAKIPSEYASIKDLLKWASPSVHKSLIQKILRTGCAEVTYADTIYNADQVLIT
ncbi:MAG: hypothetical protein R6U39_09340, partial [Candidatus Aegiribacteria sp.]